MADETQKVISYTLRIDNSQVKKDVEAAQKQVDAAQAQPAPRPGSAAPKPPPIPTSTQTAAAASQTAATQAMQGLQKHLADLLAFVRGRANSAATGSTATPAGTLHPAVAASAARLGISPSAILGAMRGGAGAVGAAGAGGAAGGGAAAGAGAAGSMAPLLPIAAAAIGAGLYLQQMGRSIRSIVSGGAQVLSTAITGNAVQGVAGMAKIGSGIARGVGLGAGGFVGGAVLGWVADKIGGAVTAVVSQLDRLAQTLAKFNPSLFAQQREIERMQRMLRMQISERMRPLLTAWNNIVKQFLELMSRLVQAPAFALLMKLLAALLRPLEMFLLGLTKIIEILNFVARTVVLTVQVVVRALARFATALGALAGVLGAGIASKANKIADAFDEWVKETFGDTLTPAKSLRERAEQWNKDFLESMNIVAAGTQKRVRAAVIRAARAGGGGGEDGASGGGGGAGGGNAGGYFANRPGRRSYTPSFRLPITPEDREWFAERARRGSEYRSTYRPMSGLGPYGNINSKIAAFRRLNRYRVDDTRSSFPSGGGGGGGNGNAGGDAPRMAAPRPPEINQNVQLNLQATLAHERAVHEALMQVRDRLIRNLDEVRNETLLLASQMDGANLARML